jgi:glutaredoxin
MKCENGVCYLPEEFETEPLEFEIPPPSISTEMYTVYGMSDCPYCVKAVDLLEDNQIGYRYYDIEAFGRQNVIETLRESYELPDNHNTVPVIYKGFEFIGGYTDLESHL